MNEYRKIKPKKIKYMDYVIKNESQLENSDFMMGKYHVRLRAITPTETSKRKYQLSGKTLWRNADSAERKSKN